MRGRTRAASASTPLLGAGSVLRLIRDGEAVTRADLARRTGLARSTVAQRVDALLAHELVYEAGGSASTGGRPPTCSPSTSAPASCSSPTSAPRTRGSPSATSPARRSPRWRSTGHRRRARARCSAWSTSTSRELLARGSARRRRTCAASASASRARSRSPPGSPSTRRSCPAGTASRSRAGSPSATTAPVLVDNDVNIMALGEHWAHWRDTEHLLFIKVGTGIGCGIVAGRAIHRGAQGAAGRHRPHPRAGQRGRGLPLRQRRLPRGGRRRRARSRSGSPRAGLEAHDSRDVVRLVRAGEPAGRAHGARGGPLARRGARRLRELLQPGA